MPVSDIEIEPYKTFLDGFNKRTRATYSYPLLHLKNFLDSIGELPQTVNETKLDGFYDYLKSLKNYDKNRQSDANMVLILGVIIRFFGHLKKTRIIPPEQENPSKNLRNIKFKTKRNKTKGLNLELREKLLKSLRFETRYDWINSILVMIVYQTGLLLTEMTELQWDQFNLEEKILRCKSLRGKKGEFYNLIPISTNLAKKLTEFKNKFCGKDDRYLFPRPKNKNKHLDKSTMESHFNTIKSQANLGVTFNSTVLRDSFILNLIESGVLLPLIMKISRVKSISNLQKFYSKDYDEQEIKNEIARVFDSKN